MSASLGVARRLTAMDARLSRIRPSIWFLSCLIFLVIKSGLYFGHNFVSEALWDPGKRPVGLSILLDPSLGLAVLAGIRTRPLYEAFSLLLAIVILGLIGLLLRRSLSLQDSRWALTIIALGPIGALLFRHFGRYDAYLVLGAAIVVLGYRSRAWLPAIGAVVMALGNAGQATATSFALLAITFTPLFRPWRRVALLVMGVSVSWLIAATVIGNYYNVASQLDYLPMSARASLGFFFGTFPLITYSVYGIGWLLVFAAFLASPQRSWLLLSIGFVLIPMTFMAITTDGTRVGVGVALLPAFAACLSLVPRIRKHLARLNFPGSLTMLVTLAILMPNLWISFGALWVPWEWAINEFRFWWTVLGR